MRRLLPLLASVLLLSCSGEDEPSPGGGSPAPTPPEEQPTPVPANCAPISGGPHWIEEGETVSFTITCSTGAAIDAGGFAIDPLPPGASFDAATGAFSWTPALDAAAVYRPDVRVVSTGETARIVIGVADRYDDPANVPVVDRTRYTEEYGLPVFFISPGPVDDDDYVPVTITYRGHVYAAEAKKRGVTSIHYPKNSYTLRFDKEDKFDDEERGFDGVRRLALTQTFDDNSYLRNRLAFTLWNRMDPAHVQIRSFSAVVYLDGKYWGLYTATDHVDDNLMKDNGLGEDGDLYKAVTHEANWDMSYNGVRKDRLNLGFVKEDGLPAHGSSGAYTELNALVAFVGTAGDAQFYGEVDSRIETREYQQWWCFARFLNAEDSVGKNSFHYLPVGGKWRYVPWDFNASFGQTYTTTRRAPSATSDFTHKNKIFARFLANDARRGEIDGVYREALDGPWALEDVLDMIDSMAAEVRPSAKRDERKWAAAYRSYPAWSARTDFTDFEGEVAYVRWWIAERWERESLAH